MRPLTTLTVTEGTTATASDLQSHDRWAWLNNESPLNLTVSTSQGARNLPAWTGDLFDLCGEGGYPALSVAATAILNVSDPPATALTGDLYYDSERGILPPRGPVALARQVSLGNAAPLSTSATSVQNDGNTPATQILESTPSDQGVSAFSFKNDGSGTLQVLSAGTQRVVLKVTRGNATTGKATIQIGDPADTSITTLNGTSSNPTAHQLDATNSGATGTPQIETASSGTTGAGVGVKDGSTGITEVYPTANDGVARALQLDYIDSGGALHAGPRVAASGFFAGGFFHANGAYIAGASHFSGTGAGTFNHNLATTPNYIGITSTETNSTETVGVDTISSGTVHVNQGVGGWPWTGFATAT